MRVILAAILDMPRRIHGGFADPLRRSRLFWRAVESYVGGLAAIVSLGLLTVIGDDWFAWYEVAWGLLGLWYTYVAALAAPLGAFLVYEFILEPLGRAGHYWERPPRDGETYRYW